MRTLYLIEQNTILRKRGNRLLLCKRPPASRRYSAVLQKDILLDLPCANVDHVMVFGNIQVTTSALHKMLERGVELALFSFRGELLGQLTPPMGKNIPLRIMQFHRYQDQDFIFRFSAQIVMAKIKNALTVLRQFQKNHPEVFSSAELNVLLDFSDKIKYASHPNALLGIEGAAAGHYFKLFGRMLKLPWVFEHRTKRPPGDPVNAVLSFGYVVCGSQLQTLLDGVGLDPYLGYFHKTAYGRPSLALDILEEFRHPLIDRLVITLFNKNILQEGDFFWPASGGCYLNTSGKKKFFIHYQKMLGKYSVYDIDINSNGYLTIFQRQIQKLVESIREGKLYEPYYF